MKSSDIRKLLPGILISLISLAVIFALVDIRELIQAIRLADARYIALMFFLTLVWLFVRAALWRLLLQDKATYSQVFFTIGEGYLLNNVLPFRLGEVGRAFLLSRKAGLGFMQVLSTILIERAFDIVMAVAILLFSLPFVVGGEFARQAAVGIGALVAAGLVALFVLARNQAWAERNFDRIADRIPVLKRLSGQVHAFFEGLQVLTSLPRFIKFILLLLVNWGIGLLQMYLVILAFFPNAQPVWAAFTLGVMAMGVAVPSSPGSIGVLEASFMAAMALFVSDKALSLAAALTAHLANYLVTGLIGAFGLARDGMSLGSLYTTLQER